MPPLTDVTNSRTASCEAMTGTLRSIVRASASHCSLTRHIFLSVAERSAQSASSMGGTLSSRMRSWTASGRHNRLLRGAGTGGGVDVSEAGGHAHIGEEQGTTASRGDSIVGGSIL